MATETTTSQPVLFFDGVCNLCNSVVQFVIRHDMNKRILFASLQSEAGRKAQISVKDLVGASGSAILSYNGKFYTRSAAVLTTFKLMGGMWSVLYAGMIFPAFIRDRVYEFVAANRYTWFGKKNECMVPTPELKSRFLA